MTSRSVVRQGYEKRERNSVFDVERRAVGGLGSAEGFNNLLHAISGDCAMRARPACLLISGIHETVGDAQRERDETLVWRREMRSGCLI